MRRGRHHRHEHGHHGHHRHHLEMKEDRPSKGAQTFRRKRALEFLNVLQAKEALLKKQLDTSELQAANPVIAGELKATQSLMEDFVKLFQLHEVEEVQQEEQQ